ncbi:CGNR zinc finger domain-containing protein [Streptacidiphilus fuscans]|uniref:CGNR zinc finger domain-containing protein n=1 Tax=Streptacidiphilus fuscans TaxID=2789292 RepID=A0A931B5F9_9ACTN|nr:CGNR zinc finger domain-containing protein [Streptacidiphilus fuscans]MBF9068228.1 CGNR zinc finger domain-containing protein [Streptacidiphilus fuscans]
MEALVDPRPLRGEPISLDLLNTRWRGDQLFHDPDGLAIWLASNGLTDRAPDSEATLGALLRTRDALLALRTDPDNPDAADALNAVLAHGRIRRVLGPDGLPHDEPDVTDPTWLPAWLAADDYLRLLARDPGRIRECVHENCILTFFDTSQNGRRRWCDMARCGNRAKAARHYAQQTKEAQKG